MKFFNKMFMRRQFLYDEISVIIFKHDNLKTKTIHIAEIFLYLMYIFRFSLIILGIRSNIRLSKYDFFDHFFHYFSTDRDFLFPLTFIMLFVYCICMENRLYFTPINTITWQMYDDLVIKTMDAYEKSKSTSELLKNSADQLNKVKNRCKNLHFPDFLVDSYSKIWTKIQVWLHFGHVDLKILAQLRMHYFHSVNVSTKVKIIQTIILADRISNFIIFIICKYFLNSNKKSKLI